MAVGIEAEKRRIESDSVPDGRGSERFAWKVLGYELGFGFAGFTFGFLTGNTLVDIFPQLRSIAGGVC